MDKRKRFILITLLLFMAALPWGVDLAQAGPGGGTWYANSPAGGVANVTGIPLRKFVDSLAGMAFTGCTPGVGVSPTISGGTCNQNNLGNYIPIAIPDTGTYTGADYYVIGLRDYTTHKMHQDLIGTTKLRGYYEITGGVTPVANSYLGPVILATKDRPVRIKFENNLGVSPGAGDLFIPVDTTVMGAGLGPLGGSYTQNRATLHLHGGHTPWISDGTPHQWITPLADTTLYKRGDSQKNVPDMPDPNGLVQGSATFYYTNQQSGRLMFYHDHVYGITRLNVYAGEAAGYLIVDPTEEALITAGTLPNICAGGGAAVCSYRYGIPLVIQDKTFVPANVATQDTLWNIATWGAEGNLWFPHVYEPNQNPLGFLNAMGRWDYGPWVWPPTQVTNPVLPALSTVPEAFMDTPIVNGTAYPFLPVEAKAYRFRILSAANDRTFNLQLYYGATAAGAACASGVHGTCTEVKMVPAVPTTVCASLNPNLPAGCFPTGWPMDARDGGVPDPATVGPSMILIGSESGLLPATVTLANTPISYDGFGNVANKTLMLMPGERADVIIDFTGVAVGSTIILYNDAAAPLPGGDARYDYYTGNPDQTLSGGAPSTLAGFGPNTRTIMQFQVVAAAAPFTTVPAGLTALMSAAYTASQDAHIVPPGTYAKLFDTSMTIGGRVIPFMGKSINEGFDSIYGRINNMIGTQDPSGVGPPVPLEYIAPATEIVRNGQVQLWKITHNGVDAHPMHFHLTDVQVVNRIAWGGTIKPPDPSEAGWKETVRMNPLEEVIIAMRPTAPTLPFTIPNSVRRLDTTQPISATNPLTNFGWEYVWHCHILGHEEFDLMRPIILNVDQLLYASFAGTGIQQWDMGVWTQINPTVPANMVVSGSTLYGTFAGFGLYAWNGSAWTQINPTVPVNMVVSGSTLYGTFAGFGLYAWNGSAWTRINPNPAARMVVSGSVLYVDFGAGIGLYKYEAATGWTQINPNPTARMAVSGSVLYVDFGAGIGLYKYDTATGFTHINPNVTSRMAVAGSDLYVDFGAGIGLYKYAAATGWTHINPNVTSGMVASGSILYANFGAGIGLWKYDAATGWTNLTATDPTLMVAGL